MHRARSLFSLAAVVFAVSLPVACGGGSEAPPSTPIAVTGEVVDMPVVLAVDASNREAEPLVPEIESSLKAAFTNAGYKLVEKEDAAALRATARVTATEKPSFMVTTVNGQRQVTYDVKVELSMHALSSSELLDQDAAQFTSGNGQVDATAVRNGLVRLTNRGKIAAYAAGLARQEDELWSAANVEDCRKATSETACDGVNAYLEKYPAGQHAADARKALEDFEGSAAARKDEEAWATAKAEGCRKPKALEDCSGVEKYLADYPTGAYAEEAKTVLAEAGPTLEVLSKKAEAEAARRDKQDCIKSCKRRYINYAPGAYNILVGRCIQLDCT